MALEIKVLDYGDIELEFEFFGVDAIAAGRGACRSSGFLSSAELGRWSSIPATALTRSWKRWECAACNPRRT